MGKRIVYTKITPLPSNVPRQLALELLHSHSEMIKLNPLVTGVCPVEAPRNAASDEFFSQWYEISEIITWGLGLKKKISFKGVFHDQPWGLQSHVYAPMGVDMRNKYRIGGNQPSEPREARELGVDTPLDGLYLREDVDITCSVPLTAGFVAKEAKAATAVMIARLSKKAELLDEGKLHAMFEHGRLKTSKPNGNPTFGDMPLPSPISAPGSPLPQVPSPAMGGSKLLPTTDDQGFGNYHDLVARESRQRQGYGSQNMQAGYIGSQFSKSSSALSGVPENGIAEVPGSFYHTHTSMFLPPLQQTGQSFMSELPGDFQHSGLAPPPTQQTASDRRRSSQYAAYQPPQRSSLQPSPQLSHESSSYSNDKTYKLANPDIVHPAHREGANSTVAEWQSNLHDAAAAEEEEEEEEEEEAASIQHSRVSSQYSERSWPLQPQQQRGYQAYKAEESFAQQFSQLNMQQVPSSHASPNLDQTRFSNTSSSFSGPRRTASTNTSFSLQSSKCPVCHLFEGDEAAVSHHVSKAHGFA